MEMANGKSDWKAQVESASGKREWKERLETTTRRYSRRARHRSSGIRVLITVDRHIEYQQNIPMSGLALVVLEARSTRMPDILPYF